MRADEERDIDALADKKRRELDARTDLRRLCEGLIVLCVLFLLGLAFWGVGR
jgi:hypothetical protein